MIPLHKTAVPDDLDAMMASLRSVIESGWVGEGPRVAAFEEALRPIVGSDYVTAVNSGTSALTLALRLAGVGPGDEVVTTPVTCMATNLPILLAGARPVWADVDPNTGNINVQSIPGCLTDRTKAIMAVHWGGYPCDMNEINALARSRGIKVIEDAAHALGASYQGRPIGSHSDFVCFSFQAIKHIHAGDGGLLCCRNMVDHSRARSLKWFGIDRERRQVGPYGIAEWEITDAGYKMHMNDIAATIGLSLLPGLARTLAARAANAAAFRQAFAGLKRITLLKEQTDRLSANWLFTMRVDDQIGFVRDMKERGVDCSIVHARNDHAPVFSHLGRWLLPGVNEFASSMICIPVGQWLSQPDRDRIIEIVSAERW